MSSDTYSHAPDLQTLETQSSVPQGSESFQENVSVRPETEKKIVTALSSFFGLKLNGFSPQTVFDLCTKEGRFPLLEKFSQSEDKASFVEQNPEIKMIVQDLEGVLAEEDKKKEKQQMEEQMEGRGEILKNFLSSISPPYFGIPEGAQYSDLMVKELLKKEVEAGCDMIKKMKDPKVLNAEGDFLKQIVAREVKKEKNKTVDAPEKYRLGIRDYLEKNDYLGISETEITEKERNYLLEQLVAFKQASGFDFLDLVKTEKGQIKFHRFLVQCRERYAFETALNDPVARMETIKTHLETQNYWGLEALIAKDQGALDYLVRSIYRMEVKKKRNTLTNISDALKNKLKKGLEQYIFLQELKNNPEGRKATIRKDLMTNGFLGLEEKLMGNEEKLNVFIETIYDLEVKKGTNVIESDESKTKNLAFLEKFLKNLPSQPKEEMEKGEDEKKKALLERMKREKWRDKITPKSRKLNSDDLDKESTYSNKKSNDKIEELDVSTWDTKIKEEIKKDEYKNNPRAILERIKQEEWSESFLEKLAKYEVLLNISDVEGSENDRVAINQIVFNSLIVEGVSGFNSALATVIESNDVSENLKEKISQRFNIHKPQKKTGSQIKKSLEMGFCTDENGEKVSYTEDNPLLLTEGVDVYEKNVMGSNRYQIKVDLGDWRDIRVNIPPDTDGDKIGEYVYAVQLMFALEKLGGMGRFIFGRDINNFMEIGDLDLHQRDLNIASRVGNWFLGGTEDFGGEVMGQSDINQLKHSFQWFHKKGDWATDDITPDVVRENLTELGILNDGVLQEKQFEKAGSFIQRKFGTGAPDFELLKAHLELDEAIEESDVQSETPIVTADDFLEKELSGM